MSRSKDIGIAAVGKHFWDAETRTSDGNTKRGSETAAVPQNIRVVYLHSTPSKITPANIPAHATHKRRCHGAYLEGLEHQRHQRRT